MDRIEKETRSLQKQTLIQQFKESKTTVAIVVLVVLVLSWNVHKSSDKVIAHEKLSGVLIGTHLVQRKSAPSATMLSVRLDSGDILTVVAPSRFVTQMRAEVEIYKDTTEQGSVYYHFGQYSLRKAPSDGRP